MLRDAGPELPFLFVFRELHLPRIRYRKILQRDERKAPDRARRLRRCRLRPLDAATFAHQRHALRAVQVGRFAEGSGRKRNALRGVFLVEATLRGRGRIVANGQSRLLRSLSKTARRRWTIPIHWKCSVQGRSGHLPSADFRRDSNLNSKLKKSLFEMISSLVVFIIPYFNTTKPLTSIE